LIAALWALNLNRRGRRAFGCDSVWLFCASFSGKLTFERSSVVDAVLVAWGGLGGNVLLRSGFPAIDVSGIPKFRGGISGCRLEGWYALAVCNCRFEDCRYGTNEEKFRRHCGHLLKDEGAANLRTAEVCTGANAGTTREEYMVLERNATALIAAYTRTEITRPEGNRG
jgi:hypothetical protein